MTDRSLGKMQAQAFYAAAGIEPDTVRLADAGEVISATRGAGWSPFELATQMAGLVAFFCHQSGRDATYVARAHVATENGVIALFMGKRDGKRLISQWSVIDAIEAAVIHASRANRDRSLPPSGEPITVEELVESARTAEPAEIREAVLADAALIPRVARFAMRPGVGATQPQRARGDANRVRVALETIVSQCGGMGPAKAAVRDFDGWLETVERGIARRWPDWFDPDALRSGASYELFRDA